MINMKKRELLASTFLVIFLEFTSVPVLAQKTTDSRIDPVKIKETLEFADKEKSFAITSSSNMDEKAPPRGIGSSDPRAVKEIVELEMAVQKSYNTEFLSNPIAPLSFYINSPDIHYFDIADPGEYEGDDVRKFYEYIGPDFVARLEFKEIKVRANGNIGFVYMKQNYYGKDLKGNPVHFIIRQTDGVVKENGVWKIAHTHISVPIDLETLKSDLIAKKGPYPWDKPKK